MGKCCAEFRPRGQPPAQVERRIDQSLRADRRRERALGLVQRDGGEPAARAVAGNRDPLRIEAEPRRLMRQPGQRRHGVLHRGGEGVLGREPIVEREHGRARVVAQRAAEDVVGLEIADHAAAAMHEEDGGFGLAPLIDGGVSAQAHRPGRARHGEIARFADFGRRDLGLGQCAAIFGARFVRRELPQRRGGRGGRPIDQRFGFAVELQTRLSPSASRC